MCRSKTIDYLRLFRLPNVFTAAADVAMGFLFVSQSLQQTPFQNAGPFVLLVAASCLLYTAGMVLNDIYDLEIDTEQRPQRPLPSGRINFAWAKKLGYGLLIAGVAAGTAAGFFPGSSADLPWLSGAIALVLALCVILYDATLKKTPLGPLAMGSCRFFNVLLGMSVASTVNSPFTIEALAAPGLTIAGGIGIYIVGVTWFARTEAVQSNRGHLAGASVVMLSGIALLALMPSQIPPGYTLWFEPDFIWQFLLLMLAFPIFRRALTAIADPQPRSVQAAVKLSILSLIAFDAAIAADVSQPYYAVGILALLAPTLLLGRWVYST